MLRLAGCVLVISGCAGFAGSVCRDGNMRLKLLKQIRSIYENMKYYISYQKAAVPEALRRIAGKGQEPFAAVFEEIYRRTYEEGESFPLVWKQYMEKALEETPLTKSEKKLALDFPSCLGFMEETAQAGALDELIRDVNLHIDELEREKKSKNKMIMSLGVAVGVLVSILLL
ncbi:MAG: stage III sporulation protein AB [Lachnospiraceae bacterium]|nr:stage III sporulation protein AB [Lachnospiraceae bacterium]